MPSIPDPDVWKPTTLEGNVVRLEPLSLVHHTALCAVGLDEELWRWTATRIGSPEAMKEYIETALRWQEEGTALPFAVVHRQSGSVVGSTRYANIDRRNRKAEIGWTWVARRWQRTAVNTESKYLLLHHAFETLGCMRVEFKTDALNEPSRNALLRIGARQEGILRKHVVTWDGRIRDTVYYSILDSEWPDVKQALEVMLRCSLTAEG